MTEPINQQEPTNGNWVRAHGPAALVGVLLVVAFAVTFVGWGTSGARSRNSYELVRSVRTLELLDGAWATLAPVWFAIPIVVAIGAVGAGFNWRLLTAACGLFVGCLLILGWIQVKNSILGVDAGATIGMINGTMLVATSVFLAALAGKNRGRSG